MRSIIFACLLCLGIPSFLRAASVHSAETKIDGVTFRIDKRIELFYTIASLAEYPFVNALDIEYKKKLNDYFEPYKDHETIREFQQMFTKVLGSLDAPIFFMLNLNDDLEFITLPQNKAELADSLRLQFKKFAEESDFDRFYESNGDLYRLILSTVDYNFSDFGVKGMLEEYFGKKDREFVVVLNLLGQGNFGPQISSPEGITGYCVIAPETSLGDIPGFPDNRVFYELSFHEFSHTYITPLVERYREQIGSTAHLLEPIRESMRSQAYTNWVTVVNEHITRAVTCRLAARKYGEASARLAEYRLEMGRRFIYCAPLIEKLREYENRRTEFAAFEDFFPELLSVFAAVTPEDIEKYQQLTETYREPEISDIPDFNEAFEGGEERMVIILPTAEEDAESAEKLTEFIRNFHKNYVSGAELLTDTEALSLDLSDKNIVTFGTPWGNLYLKKYIHLLPVAIERDRVVVSTEYEGEDYQLLTGWVNPQNAERKWAIFTAQKTENIVDINTIMPGQDFTLAWRYVPIRRGEYINPMQVWLPGY